MALNNLPSNRVSGAAGTSKGATLLPNFSIQALATVGSTRADFFNLSTSASVSSSTLTEVLNIETGGVLRFLSLNSVNGAVNADPAKIKVTIDGVEVLDETGLDVSFTNTMQIVGAADDQAGSAGIYCAFESIPFARSLLVEIAGDGSDAVEAMYSYYTT